MKVPHYDLVKQVEQLKNREANAPPIPHTELPELEPNNPISCSWNTYRRVVAEFVASPLQGCWIVIRDEEVLGIYPSARLAMWSISSDSRELIDKTLIKQILEFEPAVTLESLKLQCTSSPFPLAKTA